MPNTTHQPAPQGALPDTEQPYYLENTVKMNAFTNLNHIITMENTIQQPLECLGIFPYNMATNAYKGSARIHTEARPNGYWKTTGYVDGKPVCSDYSKDRAANIKAVTEILAADGHFVPKQLAPVMSARLPKKSNRKAA